MSGAAADTVHVCLRVCVCAATGVPVDRLGYFYESTPNTRASSFRRMGESDWKRLPFSPPPLAKDCAGTLL